MSYELSYHITWHALVCYDGNFRLVCWVFLIVVVVVNLLLLLNFVVVVFVAAASAAVVVVVVVAVFIIYDIFVKIFNQSQKGQTARKQHYK
jgi:hypothetical protein